MGFGGWLASVLNLLGMGGGGGSVVLDPVPRFVVPGTDRTRVTIAGTVTGG